MRDFIVVAYRETIRIELHDNEFNFIKEVPFGSETDKLLIELRNTLKTQYSEFDEDFYNDMLDKFTDIPSLIYALKLIAEHEGFRYSGANELRKKFEFLK